VKSKDSQKIITLTLSKMKKEQEKKITLHMQGVDLANYQNGFYDALIDTIIYIIGGNDKILREYIEWWLLENGKAIVVNGVNVCVKDSRSFSDFLFSLE
jgi:hypothetical protein